MGWKRDKKTVDMMQQKPPSPPKTTFMQDMEAIGKETVKIDSPEEAEAKRKKDQKTANLLKEIEAVTAKEEPVQEPMTQPPKETPMAEEKKQTAMAPVTPAPTPVATSTAATLDMSEYSPEEMAEIQESTGLDDMPDTGRRLPMVFWNLDLIDDKGNDVKPDRFYNGQTGETCEFINCALIYVKRTKEFSFYNEDTKQKMVMCRSFDTKEGIVQSTGEIKQCERCLSPNQHKGERLSKGQSRDCTTVLRVMAWDLDRNTFFMFNVARSSYVGFTRLLESNFFGQFKQGNVRRDIPLYMLHVRLNLKSEMGAGKRYYSLDPSIATDTYPKGILPKNIVMDLAQAAKTAKTMNQRDMIQDAPKVNKDAETAKETGFSADGESDDIPF